MEISPKVWFLIPSNGSDYSEFNVCIPNKKYHTTLTKSHFKIYTCKNVDFIRNLKLCRLNLELEELVSFSEDNSQWEETNNFEIIINDYMQYSIILSIYINNTYNSNQLFMLRLKSDDHHIISIDESQNEFINFSLRSRLIEINTCLIRDYLLKGLNKIEINGTPGQIHCFGEKTFGLFWGKNHNRGSFGWCSGITLYGEGAILSFSHESFLIDKNGHQILNIILENFYKFKGETKKDKCIGFLGFSNSESSEFINSISKNNFDYFKGSFFEYVELESIEKSVSNNELNILVINGNKEKKNTVNETKLSSKILKNYICSGGLLIIGLCPWGWEYISGGKVNSNSISNDINKEMGMIFTNEYFCNEVSSVNSKNLSNYFSSSIYYWKKLLKSMNGTENDTKLNLDEYFIMTKDIECHLNMDIKTSEQNKILNLIAQLLKKRNYLNLKPPFNMEEKINILYMAIACSRLKEDKIHEICDLEGDKYTFDDFDDWISMNQFWKIESNITNSLLREEHAELNLSRNELHCPVYDIPFEWQNTGVYIKHRSFLKAEFIPINKYSLTPIKSKLHVGSHSDFLRYKEEKIMRRVPLVKKIYNWSISETNNITIESPCEGIVYFEYIPNNDHTNTKGSLKKPNSNEPHGHLIGFIKFIPLIGKEVITTPIYTIDKLQLDTCSFDNRTIITDKYLWARIFSEANRKFSNLLPAWTELHGKKIILTIPSRILYRINCLIVDDLLEFWDKVIDTQNELYFNYKWTKERIVCDIQISDGYMHSGYPIATHLDIVEEEINSGGILDLKTLKDEGNWGIYHEIGHNRQSSYWTFNGTEEVTVNLFTMYSYYKLHPKLYPFNISYIKDQINLAVEYLIDMSSESKSPENMERDFREKWMANHGIAFCNYLILINLFGWNTLKTVFQVYDQLSEVDEELVQTHNNQQKMAMWIIIFSSVVGFNLKYFFTQWGWWFCIERATSEIDIQSLCVRIQNHLINIKGICVKNKVSKDEIELGYEDLAVINGWKIWKLDSLEILLNIQC
ncbi:Peptidase M60-like family protein [Cryptosporidium hominis]|nr:Peptidase M60-like family [Cryptosporidium hominis]PPA63878.1 Peptidase M60-like family protein [Cryptosporidium hominis]